MAHKPITKTVFSVTGLVIFGKLFGFVKQLVIASTFGATLEMDLINLSQSAVTGAQELIKSALVTSFVTIYIYTRNDDEKEAGIFAGQILKAFTLVAACAVLIFFAAANPLARLLGPGYDDATRAVLGHYLRLFAPTVLLYVWISIFAAALNANKRFLPERMLSVNMSLITMVIVLLFSDVLGPRTIILSVFAYCVWSAGYMGVLSRRYFSAARGNPFRSEPVRQTLRMMAPLLLGYSLVYVNQMVDRILSSGLETGSVTSLNYAAILTQFISTFIFAFASLFSPYITEHIAQGRQAEAAELTQRTASLLSLVFLPVGILTVLCAEDIVTIVYARGAFDARSVTICARALAGYGLMFLPMALREVFSRFLYAYQDSRRPMLNSSVSIALNIVLSVALCPRFGVLGVSAATTVSVLLCGVLNIVSAHRCNAALRYKPLAKTALWLLAGGVVCALAARTCLGLFSAMRPLPRFVLTTLLAGAAYLIAVSPLLLRLWLPYFKAKKANE